MLGLVHGILKEGPQWFHVPDSTAMGLIGFPIQAILVSPMGTEAGYRFFISQPGMTGNPQNVDSWLFNDALDVLAAKGNNGKTNYIFQWLCACNRSLPYFGFKSWDDFFTRRAARSNQNDGQRLQINAAPDLDERQELHDIFWLKQQPYSFTNMFNNHPLTNQFVGGSVYHAFLSAPSYHCWHAPVSGTVVDIVHVPRTYYSENLLAGFADPGRLDPVAPNNSQAFITAVATRGTIFIQAKNPTIGLMAIVFIGMAEV
ncbi:hypothetical protein PV04_10232 [Phialophora macrospora]|uniref:L-tryptophan decarboxylase PsiD-like domain-containing protein n=1 Tax=Phialophora macrospora TaxID=1851006 RepID=A0A0D2F633_9EURO|nr:hypothetical protein PV04_10232 [Phialophora macrospora]